MNPEYIYWRPGATVIPNSLSGLKPVLELLRRGRGKHSNMSTQHNTSHQPLQVEFVDPQDLNDQEIKLTTVLNDPDVEENIVYAGNSVGLHQHFLMDHIG